MPVDNAKEDKGELILLLEKKSNLCKYNAIYFQSLAYFWIVFSIIALLAVLVDGYQFQLLNNWTYIKRLLSMEKSSLQLNSKG